ncbi:type I-E CRISPR-associated protein Cas6/Cse3/CasE [Hyphomicrobium sulfonivorans]|nr:type I-E CRISPR-associated protein Cas6/Cse3/CasE [Hyphomicrobium sulfonivorans]
MWKLIDSERVAMLSNIKPACTCVPVSALAGVALEFKATLRCDGSRTQGKHRRRVSYVRSRVEIREWLKRAAMDGGCEVTYVDVGEPRQLEIKRRDKTITMSIVDVSGIVIAHDADTFERFLVFGGPGTGKVYGCGMWWIPALYEQQQREAA